MPQVIRWTLGCIMTRRLFSLMLSTSDGKHWWAVVLADLGARGCLDCGAKVRVQETPGTAIRKYYDRVNSAAAAALYHD